jgi:Zn-dependent protease with chaperone function
MNPTLVSPASQLALYAGGAVVAGLMWLAPSEATMAIGCAYIALVFGIAWVDRHQRQRWPGRVRDLLDDVLAQVEDVDTDRFEVRHLAHALPNAHSARTWEDQPLILISDGMRVLWSDKDALWFILAHEVAHHVLGHIGHRDDPDATTAEQHATLRGLELEADKWAMDLARRAGRDPLAAVRSIQVLAPIEKRALAGRPRPASHPSPDARIAAMTEASRSQK